MDVRLDAELLAAVAERDRGALEELYRRHHGWLTVRLRYRCNDADTIDEVVQDTFVAVWRNARSYSGGGEVGAWLWGIGIRTLLRAVRPRKSVIERLVAVRTRSVNISAEDELLVAVDHGDLGTALRSLSPELRSVVQATVFDGLTCDEAGRLLGIPSGTVKTRMMRAKHELREALM